MPTEGGVVRGSAVLVLKVILVKKWEEGGDGWVEEVCTWERFRAGLARTQARKGVGCDGWNAYLLRKAPEAVQMRYWRALQLAVRERRFPGEWREKVAMLFMKPGEDPSDLEGRRDIWLECHGHKLTMWLLGAEYERAASVKVPTSQAGNSPERDARSRR